MNKLKIIAIALAILVLWAFVKAGTDYFVDWLIASYGWPAVIVVTVVTVVVAVAAWMKVLGMWEERL